MTASRIIRATNHLTILLAFRHPATYEEELALAIRVAKEHHVTLAALQLAVSRDDRLKRRKHDE